MYASQWFAIEFCLWKYRMCVPFTQLNFLLAEWGQPINISRLMNLCSSYASTPEKARDLVIDWGYPLY